MATRVRSQDSRLRRARLVRLAAALAGPIAFAALALLGGGLVSPPAAAVQLRGDQGSILERVEQDAGADLIWPALGNRRPAPELLSTAMAAL